MIRHFSRADYGRFCHTKKEPRVREDGDLICTKTVKSVNTLPACCWWIIARPSLSAVKTSIDLFQDSNKLQLKFKKKRIFFCKIKYYPGFPVTWCYFRHDSLIDLVIYTAYTNIFSSQEPPVPLPRLGEAYARGPVWSCSLGTTMSHCRPQTACPS